MWSRLALVYTIWFLYMSDLLYIGHIGMPWDGLVLMCVKIDTERGERKP